MSTTTIEISHHTHIKRKVKHQDTPDKSHTYQQNKDISFDPNTAANPRYRNSRKFNHTNTK